MDRRRFLKATAIGTGAIATLPVTGGFEQAHAATSPHGTQAVPASAASSNRAQTATQPMPAAPTTLDLSSLVETWQEPWVWRPGDWPGEQLHLNVVENQNPGPAVGSGSTAAILFSYGGNTPGPTIRMRGDDVLYVKLRNLLGRDYGTSAVGPNPDPNELPPGLDPADVPAEVHEDICLGEHANGQHAAHVTNLHTHGLHVRPGLNPDGSHSDNVILRVMSQASFRARHQMAQDPACEFLRDLVHSGFLRDDEVVGEANFEFRLGNVMGDPNQSHPPGTHWYHPHSHGATHNQVASGMAGFLIIDGDVEEAINAAVGHADPDMELKDGPYDYRERLVFMQRVLPQRSQDPDAPPQSQQLKAPLAAAVNGSIAPRLITMRPGAVERWRVLNGSVDGRGYKRFMVLEGQLALDDANNDRLSKITQLGAETQLTPVPLVKDANNPTDFEALKQQLYLLALDGVPLIQTEGDESQYTIKDLAQQNGGAPNPLTATLTDMDDENLAMHTRIANCFREHVDPDSGATISAADSLRNCYVRPNEIYMVPANRADVFFQAPIDIAAPFSLPSLDAAADLPTSGSADVSANLIAAFANNGLTLPANAQATVIATVTNNGETDPTQWRIDDPDTGGGKTYTIAADDDGVLQATELKIYTMVAKSTLVAGDTYQQSLQQTVVGGNGKLKTPPQDIIVAHIVVSGDPAVDDDGNTFDVMSLVDVLPVVPPYHQPISDDELRIGAEEAAARADVQPDEFRTRIVSYSGWGAQDFPLITTHYSDDYPNPNAEAFAAFVQEDLANNGGALQNLVYTQARDSDGNLVFDENNEPIYILMPSAIRTMAIDGRKFNPNDPERSRMLVDSAEEWAVYNKSSTLWGDTDPANQPSGQFLAHYAAYPLTRGEGESRFADAHNFQIVTRAIDHPFHIHQNPFWVMRIEVPDEAGNLHNILDEPRWQDAIWVPRNGGRVVFRSHFPDYVGRYVHHCHVLLHEDNGMMTAIESVPFMDQTNYVSSTGVASPEMSTEQINVLYPPPSPTDTYLANMQFVDNNPMRQQSYPGFEVVPPEQPPAV